MNIPIATKNTIRLSALDRSRYSFRSLGSMVEVKECGEGFVEADAMGDVFIFEPFWDTPGDIEGESYAEYRAAHPSFGIRMRAGVFERLTIAATYLPSSWRIVIKAAFRPFDVQVSLIDVFMNESRARHSDWTEEQHLEHARTFVADPRIVCPPHVTGGAIDIDIKNIDTGRYVDMGCPPNTDSEISFLHSDLLTPTQYENRMTLLQAMLRAGFAPNPNEWWHYQYGETYWAAFYGYETTQYDIIKV